MKILLIIVLILILAAIAAIVGINIRVGSYAEGKIYNDIESLPAGERVAIVLGARVGADGTPSDTIYDRTLVGAEIYKAGKPSKLLLSGGGLVVNTKLN